MKALVMYGKEAGMLELREVPKPEIGSDDILVKVKAAGICGSDIGFWQGRNADLLNPPVILGHEFSGIVAEKGGNVRGWEIGERVVSDNTGYVCGRCEFCLTGRYVSCEKRKGLGYGMDGGFAEYVKISGDILHQFSGCLMRLSENISFEEGSIIEPSCNAYRAIMQDAHFLPGESVTIFGPGPVGLFCVQLAKIGGASRIIVVGVKGDEQRLKIAKELGANATIIAENTVSEEILQSNHGEYVDIVMDTAGPPIVLKHALDVIKRGGQIVKVGWSPIPFNMSLDLLVNKAVTLKGHWGYDYISWQKVLRLVEEDKLKYKPLISDVFPMSRWKEGFDKMKNKEAIKVVLKPE